MSLTLVGALVVLALVDSTSFGTLLIPIWLMLTPGPLHVRRLLTFLGTVAGFYMLVGFALVAGLGGLLSRSDQLLDNPFVSRAQLVVGVVLFVWSFFIG
ncbi:MAG: GAP family protein, partial [Cellulomonadaceae bacterium]